MGVSRGSITTRIVKDGLIFNMDPANRACYPKTGTAVTDTVGNKLGTMSGTSFSSDNLGTLVFDGTDDKINFSYINPPPPFSFFTWVNPGNVSGTRVLFYANANNYFTSIKSNKFTFGRSGVAHDVTSDTSLSTSTWYCLGATVDSSNNVVLYINGAIEKTGTTSAITPNTNLQISDTTYELNGSVGNAHIYNRALSAEEVLSNYNGLRGRFGL